MVIIATFNSSNYSLVREQKFPSWKHNKKTKIGEMGNLS